MSPDVPIEVRLQGYAYHVYIRLVGIRLRAQARMIPDPAKREAALYQADQFVRKALSTTDQHPAIKEIEDDVRKDAGNMALSAGLAALGGSGFTPDSYRSPFFGSRGRGRFFQGRGGGRGFAPFQHPWIFPYPPQPPSPAGQQVPQRPSAQRGRGRGGRL